MENMEEVFHFLEDFSKRKPKVIPQELNDYLAHVARTGDPVYQWSLVKCLFKEKLLNVITDFYETTPSIEIPPYPNVDPFNYDAMKNSLLERLDSFASAPFTVQRICELLTYPRKQYNRVDKFMRAVEKNILVVSTREPGTQRHAEPENGEPVEPIVNGSDNNSDYNVDVEMEDMSWKENSDQPQPAEPQPSSSDTHISVDDIEARLNAKQDAPMQVQEKATTEYESVTPPELNVATDEQEMKTSEQEPKPSETEVKPSDTPAPTEAPLEKLAENSEKMEEVNTESSIVDEPKVDVEMKPTEPEKDPLIIPEIKVDDAEMTEQRLAEQSKLTVDEMKETAHAHETDSSETVAQEPIAQEEAPKEETTPSEEKVEETPQPTAIIDESSSDTTIKGETDSKALSEVLTSSEESQSSSSDNTDGNSNSPKMEPQSDSQESSLDVNLAESSSDVETKPEPPQEEKPIGDTEKEMAACTQMQSDNYSISDVKSELPPPPAEAPKETPKEESPPLEEEKSKEVVQEPEKEDIQKTEAPDASCETGQ